MTDPFVALVIDALNLMHPRFASAHGRAYTVEEAAEPPAARKVRERGFVLEFYAEFRRLWDRAEPVRRGLGHIVVQGEPSAGSRAPDLLFWKLGEHGASDSRCAAVSFALLSNPSAVSADLALLAKWRDAPGYPRCVSVLIGARAELPESGVPRADGVASVFFDVEAWQVAANDSVT